MKDTQITTKAEWHDLYKRADAGDASQMLLCAKQADRRRSSASLEYRAATRLTISESVHVWLVLCEVRARRMWSKLVVRAITNQLSDERLKALADSIDDLRGKKG